MIYSYISTCGSCFLEERPTILGAKGTMNDQRILEDLLAILETNGVAIRHERLGGSGGGLCSMKGHRIFFIDSDAPAIETAALCAQTVAEMVDVEQLYLRPQVRRFISQHCHKVDQRP